MKKNKLKLSALWTGIIVMGLVAVVSGVKAYQSYNPPKVVVEGNYIEAASPANVGSEPTVGAANPFQVSNETCVGGECSYTLQGVVSGTNASTTLYSFADPFRRVAAGSDVVIFTDDSGTTWTGATSTVPMVRITITGGATTTFTATCGSASTPIASPSYALATVIFTTTTTGVAENNLTAALGGIADAGTVAKVALTGAYPYFNCIAGTIGSSTNFVSSTANANFAGKITVKVIKTQ